MHYDVKVYKTQEDYDNYNRTHYIDGFKRRVDALLEASSWLKDHEVVVVLSSDDEFIMVMRQEKRNGSI